MSDLLFQQAASGWHQSFNRSDFGRILRSEELVAQITAPGGGYIQIQVTKWDQYWGPVTSGMGPGEFKRLKFGGGTTFRQASLSDYFKALCQLSNTSLTDKLDKSDLYYPVRRFNQDSIFLPDGTSIFSALVRLANLIVIEDVDLSPDILREHLQTHSLGDFAASDATDRMRMQSASLLCVTRRGLASALPGRRIW